MKLEKYSGNPILSPNPKQPWESLVVCNPGLYTTVARFTCCTAARAMTRST